MERLVQVPGAKFDVAVLLNKIEKIISVGNIPEFYASWCPRGAFNVGNGYKSIVILDTDGQTVPSTESISSLRRWYNQEQANLLHDSEKIKSEEKGDESSGD